MLDGVPPADSATSLLGVMGTSVLSSSSLVWTLSDWDVNWIPDSAVENGVEFGKVPLIHGRPRPSPLTSLGIGFNGVGVFLGVPTVVPWILPVPGGVAFPFHGLSNMLLESSDGDELDPLLVPF